MLTIAAAVASSSSCFNCRAESDDDDDLRFNSAESDYTVSATGICKLQPGACNILQARGI